jgi:photosystem II stability/assembly factor-like uncharacterized protein
MRTYLAVIASIASMLGLPAAGSADDSLTVSWREIGPFGGYYKLITVDSTGAIYTAENHHEGLFRSSDRGDSWTRLNDMRPSDMEAAADGTLYELAGAALVSRDQGATFAPLPVDTAKYELHHIYAADGDHLYLGVRVRATRKYALLVSSDRGTVWREVSLPSQAYRAGILDSDGRLCIVFEYVVWRYDRVQWTQLFSSPQDPPTAICALSDGDVGIFTNSAYLHYSARSGRSEKRGFPGFIGFAALAPDGTIYAVGGAVHASSDGGRTWSPVLSASVYNLNALVPLRDCVLFSFGDGGLYRAASRFVSIDNISHGLIRFGHRSVIAKSDGVIINYSPIEILNPGSDRWQRTRHSVGTLQELPDGRLLHFDYYGLTVSSDAGVTWSRHGDSFPRVSAALVLVTPHSIVAMLSRSGFYECGFDGRAWRRLGADDDWRGYQAMFWTPWGGYILYTVLGLKSFDQRSGQWLPVSFPLDTSRWIYDVVAPDNSRLFVSVAHKDPLWVSTDRGSSWSPAYFPPGSGSISQLRYTPQVGLVAATITGVFQSRDYGESWTKINTPLPGYAPSDLQITRAGDVLIAIGQKVFVTSDFRGSDSTRARDRPGARSIQTSGVVTVRFRRPAVGELRAHAADIRGKLFEVACELSADGRSVSLDVSDESVPDGFVAIRIQDKRGVIAKLRLIKVRD